MATTHNSFIPGVGDVAFGVSSNTNKDSQISGFVVAADIDDPTAAAAGGVANPWYYYVNAH